jgi:capsular polysaccharide biosynthesis protein
MTWYANRLSSLRKVLAVELRAYGAIIWRRIWVVVLVVGVVALYAAYQYYHLYKTPGALKTYQSQVTLAIGIQNFGSQDNHSFNDYVSASEGLADALTTAPILTSPSFDRTVAQQISSDMDAIVQRYGPNPDLGNVQNPGALAGAITPTRIYNQVTVSVTWTTPAGAWAIAKAIGEVATAHISSYLNYGLMNTSAYVSGPSSKSVLQPVVSATVVSDASPPTVIPGASANRPALLLVLVLVAFIIGIALAFLIDYLDDRIRSTEDVEQLLQLPVYGQVPRVPSLRSNGTTRRSSAA